MTKQILWVSHFAGCGGASLGAKQAGFTPILGIELDGEIADLYRNNVGDVRVEDITEVDTKKLDIPTKSDRANSILIIQTSPECTKFSRANTAARGNYQQALSTKSANLIRYTYSHYEIFQPEYAILENVPEYRHTLIYQEFEDFLISLKYRIFKGVFNAADYGVPQTRERFIMIAAADGYPLPQIFPTHSRHEGQLSLFGGTPKKWVGWLDAVSDLVPTLPESKLTLKQQQAIKYHSSAYLIDGQNSKSVDNTYKVRSRDNPSFTLGCNAKAKVLIVDGKQKGANGQRQLRQATEPLWCITASTYKGMPRVASFVDEILHNAQVRSLNTKALARLQSFPDSYNWSGRASVDIKGIGNAVQPLFMQWICEAIKSAVG